MKKNEMNKVHLFVDNIYNNQHTDEMTSFSESMRNNKRYKKTYNVVKMNYGPAQNEQNVPHKFNPYNKSID